MTSAAGPSGGGVELLGKLVIHDSLGDDLRVDLGTCTRTVFRALRPLLGFELLPLALRLLSLTFRK